MIRAIGVGIGSRCPDLADAAPEVPQYLGQTLSIVISLLALLATVSIVIPGFLVPGASTRALSPAHAAGLIVMIFSYSLGRLFSTVQLKTRRRHATTRYVIPKPWLS